MGRLVNAFAGLVGDAVSYAHSKLSGTADDATVAARKLACFGGPSPCPALVRDAAGNFCGECNCGRRAEAELETKLHFGYVFCPRAKERAFPMTSA